MYFASRAQAGRTLGARLEPKYRYENCAVLALNDGGVVVGAQIAAQLHCVLSMLLLAEINLPRETTSVGSLNVEGGFSFNTELSMGDVEELQSEYRGYIEEQKIAKLHEMNRLLSQGGLTRADLLRGHNVILVADSMMGSSILTAAVQFLKPIKIERLIVAVPFADIKALDAIHVMADEVHCLDVIDGTFELNHYFENNDIPDHETIVKTIENIILSWK